MQKRKELEDTISQCLLLLFSSDIKLDSKIYISSLQVVAAEQLDTIDHLTSNQVKLTSCRHFPAS